LLKPISEAPCLPVDRTAAFCCCTLCGDDTTAFVCTRMCSATAYASKRAALLTSTVAAGRLYRASAAFRAPAACACAQRGLLDCCCRGLLGDVAPELRRQRAPPPPAESVRHRCAEGKPPGRELIIAAALARRPWPDGRRLAGRHATSCAMMVMRLGF
jgi:hypothetical protein